MKTRLYLVSAMLVLVGLMIYGFVVSFSSESSSGGSNNESLDIDISRLEESDTDILGFYLDEDWESDYRTMMDAGARVVNLVSDDTFFLVWAPEGYSEMQDRRVMVVLHGSSRTAYDEAESELEKAQEHGYAIVAIQWWVSNPYRHLKAAEVYKIVDLALRYMEYKYGSDLEKVALEGYSRGSIISYEVAFWDLYNDTNYFALIISNQGGLRHYINAGFLDELQHGLYGAAPFEGAHFFMYCGMEDEAFGAEVCYTMQETKAILEEYGAIIERFIQDPMGLHTGYHRSDEYHEEAIQTFIALTSDSDAVPGTGGNNTVNMTGGF